MTIQDAIGQIDVAVAALERRAKAERDPQELAEYGNRINALIDHRLRLQHEDPAVITRGAERGMKELLDIARWIKEKKSGGADSAKLQVIAQSLEAIGAAATTAPLRGGRGAAKSLPAGARGLRVLRVLCVHGIGDHHSDESWQTRWRFAIQSGIQSWAPGTIVDPTFCMYDDLVEAYGVDAGDYAEALWKLGVSGIWHGLGDFFGLSREKAQARGLFDIPHTLRWTAGMVAQWAAQEEFRADTRQRLTESLRSLPAGASFDAVIAHSLGSLVMYDTFREDPALAQGLTLITLGSQIGNPFVRGSFGGRIVPIEPARRWFHLYNPDDHAFTAAVRLTTDNFTQVNAPFDIPNDPINHDALEYFTHANVVDRVWRELALTDGGGGRSARRSAVAAKLDRLDATFAAVVRPATAARRNESAAAAAAAPPAPANHKALLIGINQYPNAEDRLEGCVNDVFLMSETLQAAGLGPERIRAVLDDRATADGIRERLRWLLDDAGENDLRILYYSGHGAQIPAYGVHEEVDHVDECLVPHDFDWSRERAITDDYFRELYSQLPYSCSFLAVFDCCHSGGMERSGAARARGLNPPDDIRHRALKWNTRRGMWVPRDFVEKGGGSRAPKARQFLGDTGCVHRLGAAVPLRRRTLQAPAAALKALKAKESLPYMPVLMHACREDELAYEYRHGVTSYGAFTFNLAKTVREARAAKKGVSFKTLMTTAGRSLLDLGYKQHAELRGPDKVLAKAVPWLKGRG